MRINCSLHQGYAVFLRCILVAWALTLAGCQPDAGRSMERVKAFRAKGDNASAAIEIKDALKHHTNNPDLYFLAGEVLADLGDLPNAEHSLRRALENGRPADQVRPILGRVLLDMEKYPEALKALRVDPNSATAAEITALRGRAYLGEREFSKARTEFQTSLDMRPSAAAKLGLAQVARAENDRAAAERLIAEVIEAEPKNLDALLLRAEHLRMDGRLDDAVAAYRQALKLEHDNVVAITELATLELARDRIDVAQPLLKQVEKLAPESPRLRFAKALLGFKQKRNEEAIAELQPLLDAIPTNAPGLLLMGMLQYAAGRYDLAQSAIASYLQRFPGDLAARRMLAATLLAKGQPHLAVNVLAPFIASTQDVGVLALAADGFRQVGRLSRARALLQRAIGLAPKSPELHTSLALTDLASGARQRAITGLETAIALGPADSRADEALIMVLLGQNQIDRAEKVASALGQRMPESSQTYVLQGAVLLAKKDFSKARESLDRALKLDPVNLQAAEALADVDAVEQKPDRRRERIETILKKDPRHLGALLALARLDLTQGRQAQSVATIRRVLSEHPYSGNALLMLADAQFRQGQVAEAVISTRQAHELHPFDARAIATLGEALLAAGDKQSAITALARLPKLQPEVVSGYLRLAAAYMAADDTKSATATVLSALEKEPQDLGARALLADIYLQVGDLDRAQMLAARTQQDLPKSALGYRMEGDVLLARKDYAGALEAYGKAAALQTSGALIVRMHQAQNAGRGGASDSALRAWIAKNPDDIDARFYLGDTFSHAGRYKEAAEQYTEVSRRLPNSARALNNLAWALHGSGDKRALQYARQAVGLAPASPAAIDTLGWIMVEQGNLGEGVPALMKAVTQDGNNPEIRYHLVKALLKIGDNGRAKAELDTLLRSNKPFPQLAEARELAARLGP